MNLNTFLKKYDGVGIQDDGSYTSDQFKKFARDFKSLVSNIAKNAGATLASFSAGHYDISGFLERDGKYVYFAFSVPRGEDPLVLQPTEFRAYWPTIKQVLIRHAKHGRDYTGGHNQFAYVVDMEREVERLLNEEYC